MLGLINLSKPFDYSKTDSYKDDISFLIDNNIPFVDLTIGDLSHQEKLQAFHGAVENKEIDTIWFISGGIELCTYLHEIDWVLVKNHKKRYIGLSDFTHFSMLATQYGVECYYGLGLAKIYKYYPDPNDQQRIVNFLLINEPSYSRELPIVGGHMLISSLLIADRKINLSSKILFLEHHYIPGETLYNLDYRIYTLLYVIQNNKPREIILGKSFLFNEDESLMDIEIINKHITEKLKHLDIPITYVDHTQHIIKIG